MLDEKSLEMLEKHQTRIKTIALVYNKAYHSEDLERIDFEDLKQYGDIQELSLEEIFGYEDTKPVNVEVQQ